MNTYEVKKFGVSMYMGPSLAEAEDCFKKANAFDVTLFHIVGSKKRALKRK